MLQNLQIENYALIRALNISFNKGFTVITGETGAGKSILMGALSLVLGNRADTDVLYDKSRKCIVEGTFDITNHSLKSFFEENDLDYQPVTTLRREINERGKSRAFINDTPTNLVTLKALASKLLDIHSQHQNLLLQDSEFRLSLIDQYAQNQELKEQYALSLLEWKTIELEYTELKRRCAEAALQQEFNNFTIQELENAKLVPGEQEEAENAIQLLSHAESIKAHLFQATQRLSDNEEMTILSQLKALQHECAAIKDISPEFSEIYNRVESSILELQDIAYDIANKEQTIEVNPKELERLNERLDLIYSLQHKYQTDSVQGLLDILSRLREEVNLFTDSREQLSQLDTNRTTLLAQTRKLAEQLTLSRQNILAEMEKEVEARLHMLALPDSRFQIRLAKLDELGNTGADSVEFLFSANQGVAVSDISKVASGGEMSRVMLALKSIVTDSMLLPTVIFDEIDTGISGETAKKVADVMKDFAQRHQVIAITHLPQIAANASCHYLVYKETQSGQTITNLKSLTPEEHIHAIATLICGNSPTEAALNAARELVKTAIPKPS